MALFIASLFTLLNRCSVVLDSVLNLYYFIMSQSLKTCSWRDVACQTNHCIFFVVASFQTIITISLHRQNVFVVSMLILTLGISICFR